jgi:hypothetical protein
MGGVRYMAQDCKTGELLLERTGKEVPLTGTEGLRRVLILQKFRP